ncbi:hypothetical protein VTN49DRAFT_5357 [Thermomyces lanuginosus]|uniref:uncharacterized protein n=1 Tax=Thermomyces lanuginosus TaxID=5541 RepID=UPI003742617F
MATTTSTDSSEQNQKIITLYDIAMRPPVEKHCCAPNPWKARLALNVKRVAHKTEWVHMEDIPKVRKGLGLPACRKFPDGSDYYTLPIVQDPSTGALVGDSFEIAVYLNKTYPDSGVDLFPAQDLDFGFVPPPFLAIPLSELNLKEYPEYAKFNYDVDGAFSMHQQLSVQGMPFDPERAEACRAEFARRAGVKSYWDLDVVGEQREKVKESFRNTLAPLAKLFTRDPSGPFILGNKVSYADIIVGGWLRMMCRSMLQSEWEELRSWHEGVFGRLHDALEVYAEVK